jgi:hypothetical protein
MSHTSEYATCTEDFGANKGISVSQDFVKHLLKGNDCS